jgi:hypothetical protein
MTGPGLEIVDPLRYPGWDELLLEQPSYSFFHSTAWARVLCETYRYRPLYFMDIERGALSIMVPLMEVSSMLTGRRGVSLPFTDYCDPMFGGPDRQQQVMDALLRFGREAGWNSMELRPGNGFTPGSPSSSSYSVHTLDLTPGSEQLFKQFRETTRRNIKKAIREGVRVTFHTSSDALAVFYRLNCHTRKEHGLPPQPYSFFKKVHEHVIGRNLGFIALAQQGGRDVAGAIYLYSRETVIYKYGASLRAYQHVRPNNLVMWRAIESCIKGGYRRLCFGRTEVDNSGLRQFKAGWGGDERIIEYFKYDFQRRKFVTSNSWSSGLHTALYRRMPIPFSKMIGRMLYRHVG